jgi:hypothetical protein
MRQGDEEVWRYTSHRAREAARCCEPLFAMLATATVAMALPRRGLRGQRQRRARGDVDKLVGGNPMPSCLARRRSRRR